MKNLILALMLLFTATSVSSASCANGTCVRAPLRNGTSVVLSTTKKIVTFPVRAVKKVQTNRACRNCN